MLNLSNDLGTESGKNMENQISFIPNRTSSSTSRMDPNQSDDPNTGSDTDKENQRLFTPKMSSNPYSTIERNI